MAPDQPDHLLQNSSIFEATGANYISGSKFKDGAVASLKAIQKVKSRKQTQKRKASKQKQKSMIKKPKP